VAPYSKASDAPASNRGINLHSITENVALNMDRRSWFQRNSVLLEEHEVLALDISIDTEFPLSQRSTATTNSTSTSSLLPSTHSSLSSRSTLEQELNCEGKECRLSPSSSSAYNDLHVLEQELRLQCHDHALTVSETGPSQEDTYSRDQCIRLTQNDESLSNQQNLAETINEDCLALEAAILLSMQEQQQKEQEERRMQQEEEDIITASTIVISQVEVRSELLISEEEQLRLAIEASLNVAQPSFSEFAFSPLYPIQTSEFRDNRQYPMQQRHDEQFDGIKYKVSNNEVQYRKTWPVENESDHFRIQRRNTECSRRQSDVISVTAHDRRTSARHPYHRNSGNNTAAMRISGARNTSKAVYNDVNVALQDPRLRNCYDQDDDDEVRNQRRNTECSRRQSDVISVSGHDRRTSARHPYHCNSGNNTAMRLSVAQNTSMSVYNDINVALQDPRLRNCYEQDDDDEVRNQRRNTECSRRPSDVISVSGHDRRTSARHPYHCNSGNNTAMRLSVAQNTSMSVYNDINLALQDPRLRNCYEQDDDDDVYHMERNYKQQPRLENVASRQQKHNVSNFQNDRPTVSRDPQPYQRTTQSEMPRRLHSIDRHRQEVVDRECALTFSTRKYDPHHNRSPQTFPDNMLHNRSSVGSKKPTLLSAPMR
jgi:hypothetical protein